MAHSRAPEMLRKDPKNLWNDYSKISKKYLNMVLRPCILKSEQEAADNLQENIKKSHFHDNLIAQYRAVVHDVIYNDLKSKREKNSKRFERHLNGRISFCGKPRGGGPNGKIYLGKGFEGWK